MEHGAERGEGKKVRGLEGERAERMEHGAEGEELKK